MLIMTVHLLSAFAIFGFSIELIESENMLSTIELGSLEFALKMDKVLSADSHNLVFSPFSLSTALAMTLMGAQSTCGEELSTVLFGRTIKSAEYESLAKDYQILVDRCLTSNGQVLSSANFLYSHIKYPILSQYKQTIETSFAAKSQELDFVSKRQEAIEVINADISRATNGKIQKLFEDLDPNTKLVLANALYFKGLWKSQFKKEKTTERKFTTGDGQELSVPTMYQKSKFPFGYSEHLKCAAVELTYDKSNCALIVLLPDKESSVREVKSKLNGQTLDQLLKQMYNQKVELFLPKFKLESTLPLIPILSKVGIKQIFDVNSANFSAITSDPIGLYVGDVIQKAVIEVNEEGTEAAAATGVAFLSRSLEFPERLEVNRPFMFFLMSKYESKKNMILFTGTVNNPKV